MIYFNRDNYKGNWNYNFTKEKGKLIYINGNKNY